MKARLIISLVFFLLIGCKKEEVPAYAYLNTYACFKQTEWDSTKVANALQGKWEWIYTGAEGGERMVSDKDVSVEFKADNTVQVYEKGVLMQSATWEVKTSSNEYYLNTNPYINLFLGRTSICEDRVEFNAAIIDASTNIFERK